MNKAVGYARDIRVYVHTVVYALRELKSEVDGVRKYFRLTQVGKDAEHAVYEVDGTGMVVEAIVWEALDHPKSLVRVS